MGRVGAAGPLELPRRQAVPECLRSAQRDRLAQLEGLPSRGRTHPATRRPTPIMSAMGITKPAPTITADTTAKAASTARSHALSIEPVRGAGAPASAKLSVIVLM